MQTPIKLSPTDKKLLAYLYQNSREPATKIAKALHLSREQISYRISKFEKEGIIKGYLPIVSYSHLGYHVLSLIFFKFKNLQSMQKFKEEQKSSPSRINSLQLLTKYDLAVLYVFKDEKERNDYLSSLFEEHSNSIISYYILEPYYSKFFPLKFLHLKTQSKIFHEYKRDSVKLDEKEIKILKILNKNANSRIIDIAKQASISAELSVYKLKKLKESGVLISTRAYFDMKKIGFFYSLLLISLPNFSKQNQEKLKNFAKQNGNIDSLIFLLGNPNCYMQLFHKSIEEINETIISLNQTFKDDSISLEIIPIEGEGEDINLLPFL